MGHLDVDATSYRPRYNPVFLERARQKAQNRARVVMPAAAIEAEQKQRHREEKIRKDAEVVSRYRIVVCRENSAHAIAVQVAHKHGMSFRDLVGASRTKLLVIARDEAIRAVADARPDMSLPAIGRVFKRDHTTILHSLRKTWTAGKVR